MEKVFLSLVLISSIQIQFIAAEKVVFVFELFRHGARDPLSTVWKKDDLKIDGELTAVGMRQHYNLGKAFKKRFHDQFNLISNTYNPDEIFVRSADVHRVIASAESQLYGMFENLGPSLPEGIEDQYLLPPFEGFNQSQSKGSALPNGYQPIPIEVIPKSEDYAIENFFNCPTFEENMKSISKSYNMKILAQKTYKTRVEVGKILNSTTGVATIGEAFDFMDILKAYFWSGQAAPHNVTDEMLQDLELIYQVRMYNGIFGTKVQQQLGSGQLLKEILGYFERFLNKESTYKLVMYSGHDTNIASLLNALGFSNPICRLYFPEEECFEYPPFASQVLLEILEEVDNQYLVRFIYNGNVLKIFSYQEFVELAQTIIPSDYDALCQGKKKVVYE